MTISPDALASALRAVGFTASRAGDLARVHPADLLGNPDAYADGRRESRRLHAVRELASAYTTARAMPPLVTGPADVAAHLGERMRNLDVEHFVVVLLSTAGRVIATPTLTVGGLAASIVEPRAVFRAAIAHNAAAVVLAHNHPSGNPEPSREDVRVTKQIVEAGKHMGIPVQDHLIIAGATFTSLAERGLM